ncbi:MAG: GtrA family protein [Patescibacteria group bacterium]|nr:GtrA family protein [Patescibacteria group bacterium]
MNNTHKQKTVFQVMKFALVGAINTIIDLGVLNLLMFVSGISSGIFYLIFKATSFTLAVANSYFMNKYWTFRSEGKIKGKEFSKFFLISIVGFIINVGSASIVVNLIPNFLGVAPQIWGNIGALAGTFLGLAWNFLGYKFVVFEKVNSQQL